MKYYISRLRTQGDYGDPCAVSQAKPVMGGGCVPVKKWDRILISYVSPSIKTVACQLWAADYHIRQYPHPRESLE